MGIDLRLFVHGVPKGQSIWGPKEDDRNYIENFYGRNNNNVDVQLFVEIVPIGHKVYCYYTYYLKSDNIIDEDSRRGSYFALTLRCNAFYADIVNMYNILDAAYHKFILGTILKSDASVTKFMVQDFNQVSKELNDLQEQILHYLRWFSIDSDFISLNGFITDNKFETEEINLSECNINKSFLLLKNTGKISVSPLFPTKEMKEFIKQKDKEIESIKSHAQQQILTTNAKLAAEIQSVQKEKEKAIKDIKLKSEQQISALNNKIANTQKEREDAINAVETKYAPINKIVKDLKEKLDKAMKKGSDLEAELVESEKQAAECNNIKEALKSTQDELNKSNKLISKVNEIFSDFGEMPKSSSEVKGDESNEGWLSKLNKFHPLVDLIVMLTLVAVMAFTLTKSNPSDGNITREIDKMNQNIEKLDSITNNINEKTTKLVKQTESTPSSPRSNHQSKSQESSPKK